MKRYIKSAKDFPHALADVCEQNGWLDLYDGSKKNDFYYLVKQGIGLDEVSHLIWLGTSEASLSYHDIYDVIKDISDIKASKRTRKSAVNASFDRVTTIDEFNRKYGETEYGCWELREPNESYDDEIQCVLYEIDPEYNTVDLEAAFDSIDKAVRYVLYMDELRSKDPIYNPDAEDIWY